MILMGNLPFRVAFKDSTQPSRECQLFLLCDHASALSRDAHGKSSAAQSKRYNLAAR